MKIISKNISINKTAEGLMIPIFRNWDSLIPGYQPAMVYATTIGPNMKKGPILHRFRSGYMTSIGGDVSIEYIEDNEIKKIGLNIDIDNVRVVSIPAGMAIKIINNSNQEAATIINLPDIAWHPDNQDTEKFENWERFFEYVKK